MMITVQEIVSLVADYYGIDSRQILDSSLKQPLALYRQVAMYLARTETSFSFPQIGREMGGRHHTTIMHGYRKIAYEIEVDGDLRYDVIKLRHALAGGGES